MCSENTDSEKVLQGKLNGLIKECYLANRKKRRGLYKGIISKKILDHVKAKVTALTKADEKRRREAIDIIVGGQ